MASAVIGALRVNLGIDTAQFTEGLKGVRASLDRVGKNLQKAGTKLSTYVTAPITAAGALITAAVTTMAKDIEGLQKAAQISNTGFEEFQKLAFAARSVGIEGDKLADIFKDVNDRVGDFNATGGGPMKDFFENIAPKVNLTADAFKNLSGPQALQLYYDSLVKAGASQQDMTFYLEAMASDTTALIPLLRDGGKAFRELGEGASVISEGDAAGLAAYNDATRALGESLKGVTIALANSGILEFVTGMANKLAELVKWMAQTNPEILKWGTIVAGLAATLGPTLIAVGLLATGIAAISAPVLLVVGGIAALTAGIIAFYPQIKAADEAIQAWAKNFDAAVVAAFNAGVEKVKAFGAAVQQLAANVVTWFAELPARMMEIGGQIIDGLWQGIQAKWESVKNGISGMATGIADRFRSALSIFSPSRVMHDIGINIMQGLSNGMDSMSGAVTGGVESVADGIAGAFSGIGSGIADAIKGTKSWKDVALDAIRSIGSALLANMSFGGGFFGSIFKGLLGGLIGFKDGGSFTVGGAGGTDSQLVAFRATPGEMVDVRKGNQARGGAAYAPVYNIDARGADAAAVARLEAGLKERDRKFGAMVDTRANVRQTRGTRP